LEVTILRNLDEAGISVISLPKHFPETLDERWIFGGILLFKAFMHLMYVAAESIFKIIGKIAVSRET
jgi:hypothetical protein